MKPASPSSPSSNESKRSRSGRGHHRRARLRIVAIVAGVLVLVGLSTAWLAYRAEQAKLGLEASVALLPSLQEHLIAGDAEAAKTSLTSLKEHTAKARSASTDPLWRAASTLPFVGGNFAAVTEVSVSADDVVNRAIAPLVDRFDSVDWGTLAPAEGKIELEPLQAAAPSLAVAATTVQLSYDRLERIDRSTLYPEIATAVGDAVRTLDGARGSLNSASAAADLLPAMLGSEGPRNYLVLIQNSAEIRATGGIPGALAVITADDGQLTLTAQGSPTDIGYFQPPLAVDKQQELIYTDRLGTYMQNVNLTPDFPTVGQTAKTMWEERMGGPALDGVIALDTVALGNILEATGPVALPESEDPIAAEFLRSTNLPTSLTSDNVIETLLSAVYLEIEDPAVQDAYFAAVAAEVFGAISSGQGEGAPLVQALMTSTEQHRLYVWSQDPNEQKVIANTALAGSVTGSAAGGASFGLYFNDGTGAKMDYYVRRTAQLHQTCGTDGYSHYTLTVTLKNTAALDSAVVLPKYVTGGGAFGVEAGTVKTNIIGYGPTQSLLGNARVDGKPAGVGSYTHGNRPVGVLTTTLGPGESVMVELDFEHVIQTMSGTLNVTPTVQGTDEVSLPTVPDGSCAEPDSATPRPTSPTTQASSPQ